MGQTLTATANPLAVLKARDGIPDWNQIKQLLEEWQPDQVLVGLPLNMDGSESDFCARARKFARRLHGMFGQQVSMVDERLSTFEAKGHQTHLSSRKSAGDISYRDHPVDDLAAVIILQSWLSDPEAVSQP